MNSFEINFVISFSVEHCRNSAVAIKRPFCDDIFDLKNKLIVIVPRFSRRSLAILSEPLHDVGTSNTEKFADRAHFVSFIPDSSDGEISFFSLAISSMSLRISFS
jgi:hypothetical protein